MKNQLKKVPEIPNPQTDFEDLVYEALRKSGAFIPETEEEVRRFQENVAERIDDIPDFLSEPPELPEDLLPSTTKKVLIHNRGQKAEIEENLARAAREGGEIDPETEERMRKDREQAESQSDSK